MELNSAVGRADGVSDEQLDALQDYERSELFSDFERAALAYAEAITTADSVSEDVFTRLRNHFNDDQIVELTAVITFEICAAKFSRALEIEAQGVCRIPRG